MRIIFLIVLSSVLMGCETQVVEPVEEKSVQIKGEVLIAASNTFCDQLNGQTWQTVEQFDAGRSMNGMAKMHWTLGFDGGQFRWRYADVVEMGTYVCNEDTLILSSAMQDPRATAQFNNELSQLIINEKVYVLHTK